jgi:regulatory protein
MSEGRRIRKPPSLLDASALWDFALKTLGGRALSASELRQKLRSRAASPADVEQVILKLKEYGYINDAQFAEMYATARRDTQGLGKSRVLNDLRRRRVEPAVAEKAVTTAYEGVDETSAIEQYLARKYRSKNLRNFLQEQKNLASAFRRLRYAGFSAGASIRVLKRYAAQAEELEGMDEGAAEEES